MKKYYSLHPEKLRANRDYLRCLRAERKQRLIQLKGGRCVDCGYSGHLAALEFDHLDPRLKVAALARLLSCRWGRAIAEVEKCDLVCANCHAIRTYIRLQKG